MKIMNDARKEVAKYAWPGGYPIIYYALDGSRDSETNVLEFNPHDRDKDGSVCCPDCARNVEGWPDIILVGQDIHYEGQPEVCEWCNGEVASAYGEPPEDIDREDREESHGT